MSGKPTGDAALMPLVQHRAADLVAFGNLGARTAADLLRDTALLAQQLPRPSEGSEVLLVFRHDRYAFAAALLASWSAGHAVALPPNTRRESIWKTETHSHERQMRFISNSPVTALLLTEWTLPGKSALLK